MTRTEDRLTDALHTAAGSVQEETLRPLQANPPSRHRWPRGLVPVAAAAGVALVLVLVSVIVPRIGQAPGRHSGTAAHQPRFYVVHMKNEIQVVSIATQTVTAIVPQPSYGSGASRTPMYAAGVTPVGSGEQEFIASFVMPPIGKDQIGQTKLYSFRLTSAGHVADLSPVRGGTLNGLAAIGLATSPDGSKLAISACQYTHGGANCQYGVMVIDLSTGASTLWAGGLGTSTGHFTILSVGWAPSGGSVTFLAASCPFVNPGCGPGKAPQAQFRELSLSTGGGSLAHSTVLFAGSAQYPYLRQAQLSSDGRAVTLLYVYGPFRNGAPRDVRIVQVPITGGPPRVLYGGLWSTYWFSYMQPGAPAGTLVLTGSYAAWVSHGKVHVLLPRPRPGGEPGTVGGYIPVQVCVSQTHGLGHQPGLRPQLVPCYG
jgi:hypothetical protein